MGYTIYLEFQPHEVDDPLGEQAISALVGIKSETMPIAAAVGSFRQNLYLEEEYLGSVNVIYSGLTAYHDPLVGTYTCGTAYVEEPDVHRDLDDELLRSCILDSFRQCGFSVIEEPMEFDVRELLLREREAKTAQDAKNRRGPPVDF